MPYRRLGTALQAPGDPNLPSQYSPLHPSICCRSAHLRAEGGVVMGSVPLLVVGAERAPQGFLADAGFTPAAAAAGMGLMAWPVATGAAQEAQQTQGRTRHRTGQEMSSNSSQSMWSVACAYAAAQAELQWSTCLLQGRLMLSSRLDALLLKWCWRQPETPVSCTPRPACLSLVCGAGGAGHQPGSYSSMHACVGNCWFAVTLPPVRPHAPASAAHL